MSGFDKYRRGHGGDVGHWLAIHRAGRLLYDRKTGAKTTIYVPRAAISIVGGIQPKTLRRALGSEHFDNGLAPRLLVVMPPRRPKRWSEATIDVALQGQIEKLYGRFLALQFGTDENDCAVPMDLRLAPDAKTAWVRFVNEHGEEQLSLVGVLASAWSKLESYAARLGLVVHFARWATDDPTLAGPDIVDEQSVAAGVTLVRWFGHEARRVYAALQETEEDRERRELIELIQRKGGSVTPRDVMRSSRRYGAAAEAESALDDLAKAGIGRWEEAKTTARGGRPTRRLVIVDTADVDETPSKPEQNRGCVNVNAVNACANADRGNAIVAEAAEEDDTEWGEV